MERASYQNQRLYLAYRFQHKNHPEESEHDMTPTEQDRRIAERLLNNVLRWTLCSSSTEYELRELTLAAIAEAKKPLEEDMIWLEQQDVEVRTPLVFGSRHCFTAQAVNEEGEPYKTNLWELVRALRRIEELTKETP